MTMPTHYMQGSSPGRMKGLLLSYGSDLYLYGGMPHTAFTSANRNLNTTSFAYPDGQTIFMRLNSSSGSWSLSAVRALCLSPKLASMQVMLVSVSNLISCHQMGKELRGNSRKHLPCSLSLSMPLFICPHLAFTWHQSQAHAMQVMSGKYFRAALIKQQEDMQQGRCIALLL